MTNQSKLSAASPDGTYELLLGPLIPEYVADTLFASHTPIMRRITAGQCFGECGHPRRQRDMSLQSFMSRAMAVDHLYISHQILALSIVPANQVSVKGHPLVKVIGTIKPCGPWGKILIVDLESQHPPSKLYARSIKTIYDDESTFTVVTWDYIITPTPCPGG